MKKQVKKAVSPPKQSWSWAVLVLLLFSGFFYFKTRKTTPPVIPPDFSEKNWQQMGLTISKLAESYKGEVGIYIKDLKTGRTYLRNPDRKFVTASLIKVPIMASTFKAVKEGRLKLSSQLKLQNYLRRSGSGDLRWAHTGRKFQVSDLLFSMITQSDNTAAAMLIDRLGYSYLNKSFQEFGLSLTRIDPVGMSLANKVNPGHENYTTPREMGIFLERIYRRELVSDGFSDLMIEIMKHAESPSRLSQYLPSKWVLARKSGLLRKNCHDMGIVFTGTTDFVICVMTDKNPNYQTAKGVIANIGQTAYAFLGNS